MENFSGCCFFGIVQSWWTWLLALCRTLKPGANAAERALLQYNLTLDKQAVQVFKIPGCETVVVWHVVKSKTNSLHRNALTYWLRTGSVHR